MAACVAERKLAVMTTFELHHHLLTLNAERAAASLEGLDHDGPYYEGPPDGDRGHPPRAGRGRRHRDRLLSGRAERSPDRLRNSMLTATPTPEACRQSAEHVFVRPTVREIPRPTEPAVAAATW